MTDEDVEPVMNHPDPTFWHVSLPAERKVYVWGGRTPNRGFGSSPAQQVTIDEFDTHSRSWSKRSTNGTAHPGLSQVAGTSYNKVLYFYGGSDGKRLNGVLSQLDLETMDWSPLSEEPQDHKIVSCRPMRKDAAGMVYLKSTDGKEVLLVMCGYADPNDADNDHTGGSSDKKSSFRRDSNSKSIPGWTNEMQFFEIDSEMKDNQWSVPVVVGERPEPCGDITLVRTAQERAVFCGGFGSMLAYMIEFGSEALDIKRCHSSCPKNRLGQHAADCLGSDTSRPQLLMCGGRGATSSSGLQEDIWMLDIQSEKWREEHIPKFESTARWGHTVTTVVHSDQLLEVLMIGGSREKYHEADLESFNTIPGLDTTVSLVYGLLGNAWELLSLTDGEKWTFCKGTDMLLSITGDEEGETKPMEGVTIGLKQYNTKFKLEDHGNSIIKFLIHCLQDQVDKYQSRSGTTTVPPAMLAMAFDVEKSNKSVSTHKGFAELRGVDVCGETTIFMNKSAMEFKWRNYGFKLIVSENSLPEGVEQCAINIKASVSGQYQFPDNGHLVSATFWLSCDPPCRFQKPITVGMDHCAKPGDAAKLGFVRAKCTQGSLPYMFKKIEGGRFMNESRYGAIELNGFSAVGVTSAERPVEYGARLYSIVHQNLTSYKLDFVVTLNTETHLMAVSDEYMKYNAHLEREALLEFESDKISFDIPDDGIEIHEGRWKIIPQIVPAEIMRRHVDNFHQGKVIPKCQFSANISGGEEVPPCPLQHRVNLAGTKIPRSFMLSTSISPLGPLSTGSGPLPANKLDMVIDAAHRGVSKHLGRIADYMTEWEGRIAEELDLSDAEITAIKREHPNALNLQKREALKTWKTRKGSDATYNNLIKVFEAAGYPQYAEFTKNLISQ